MTEILLWVILALVIVSAMLNMSMYSRLERKRMERQQEDEVQRALDEAYRKNLSKEGHDNGQVQKAEEVSGEDRGRAMDEGFDNIMRYSVNLGRGRSTGGEP